MCGYRRCVFTTLVDMDVEPVSRPQDVCLPRRNSHLFNTLACLWHIAPANSREITDTLILHGHDFTVSDVSSYLMMLRTRSLVRVIEYKRGIPGGSTWECTEAADDLLEPLAVGV